MRTLPRFVGLLLAIAACHGGGTNSSPRGGMVTDATAFPVVVSNLDTTAKFSWAGGAAKSLALAWQYAVPERPIYPTIALASQQQPDRRDVAFAAMRDEGTMVYHGSYTRGAPLASLQPTLLAGMRILPSFPVALSIDPSNGHALVSLLVAGPGATTLSLVDLEYEQPSGPPGQPKVYRFRSFPGQPAGGGVFHTFPEGQPRRKVVIVTNDRNEVYAMKRMGKLVRQQASLVPARPLSVLAGKNMDYLLCTHPERGLLLEPIHD